VPNADVDADFLALPLDHLADAALTVARARGATYADFRLERLRSQTIVARDRELQTSVEGESVGFSVRVVCKGAWGFAAGIDLTADAVASVARRAVEVAESLAPLNTEPVTLADEPAYTDTYVSGYEIDPFAVAEDDKIHFLLSLNDRALASRRIDRVTSYVMLVREQKYLASLSGSRITQQRVRVKGDFTAVRIDKSTGAFETMGSAAPPAGRGWEYFTKVYDFVKDADEIPALLEQKMASPSVVPGRCDVVIDPTNLWLTIHESIGHSTELDRVLGYEANYAGTSFATLDKLHTLQFGAPMMHVTGDRQIEHGLSTVGYDDEGVAAQTWDIIRDGVLVGYQLDRQMAHKQGFGRSNGCAFADQSARVPLQRMPNVSLRAATTDITLSDLLAGMGEGLYIVGDKSWSIDMQRYNFQFTGQKFFQVRGGKIVGQVKDVAYQSRTTDFWNAMEAVGGPSTYLLGGAFNCGKGQPGQIAPVTHGCPAALFRQINILNTAQEGR
jgi:TldD protein